jgi:MFS family permease
MLEELLQIFGMPVNGVHQWQSSRLPSCKFAVHSVAMPILNRFPCRLSMGPCLGPLIGGWIAIGTHGWRWIYWTLFIFLGCIFVFTCFAPETYAPILLKKKAARMRKEHNTNAYRAQSELNQISLSQTLKISLTRPFIFMFCEPIVLCMSIFLSFIYR